MRKLLLLLLQLLTETLRLRPMTFARPRNTDRRARRYPREFAVRSLLGKRTRHRTRFGLLRRRPNERGPLRFRAAFETDGARRHGDFFNRLKLLRARHKTRAQQPREQRSGDEMKRYRQEKGPK